VPRADLTLISAGPPEVRQLDINAFRLELKAIEASEEGEPFEDTHQHNTSVNLSGVTFARTVEIINGYTVTFEDGQYAVNLVGANSNIADVANVNQVSIRSFNAAGLISVTSGSGLDVTQAAQLAQVSGDTTAILADTDTLKTSVTALQAESAVLILDTSVIKKHLQNRLEVDFTAQELVLYDDDGVTPLRRWPIETAGGENVTTGTGVQTKRKANII